MSPTALGLDSSSWLAGFWSTDGENITLESPDLHLFEQSVMCCSLRQKCCSELTSNARIARLPVRLTRSLREDARPTAASSRSQTRPRSNHVLQWVFSSMKRHVWHWRRARVFSTKLIRCSLIGPERKAIECNAQKKATVHSETCRGLLHSSRAARERHWKERSRFVVPENGNRHAPAA